MQVWRFSGAGGLGELIGDEAGAYLPLDLGPWQLRVTLSLDDIDPGEREAR